MNVYVVVATKGRAKEVYTLLTMLKQQSCPIEEVIVVGHEQSDIQGLDQHPSTIAGEASLHLSPKGSCHQRNWGLDVIKERRSDTDWFVVFFDDDFRPHNDWIKECADRFNNEPEVIGTTGYVLADGVHMVRGYTEDESQQYINGEISPALPKNDEVNPAALYGCNMAFRGVFAKDNRFDENLPMYGWQEDYDYSSRAAKMGVLVYTYSAIGVHLGASNGRTSGVRFGYSQIANPIYLVKKGTMPMSKLRTLMSRNIISNVFRTVTFCQKRDYRGRLYGNLLAFKDLLTGKCHPTRINEL